MSALGQGRLSRQTDGTAGVPPSSGNTPSVRAVALSAISRLADCAAGARVKCRARAQACDSCPPSVRRPQVEAHRRRGRHVGVQAGVREVGTIHQPHAGEARRFRVIIRKPEDRHRPNLARGSGWNAGCRSTGQNSSWREYSRITLHVERWPASPRNPGRLPVAKPSRNKSVSALGTFEMTLRWKV
jgi:hypothetical protein